MQKSALVIASLFLFTSTFAQLRDEVVKNTKISGAVSYAFFQQFNHPIKKSCNSLLFTPQIKSSYKKLKLLAEPQLFYFHHDDPSGFLSSSFNPAQKGAEQFGGFFRNAYLKYEGKNTEIKAGLVSYNFGTADFQNPVDQINSRDLRMIVFADNVDKKAIPSIDVNYYFKIKEKEIAEVFAGIMLFSQRSIPTPYAWLPRQERELYDKFSTDEWLRQGLRDSMSFLDSATIENLVHAHGGEIPCKIDYKTFDGINSVEAFLRLAFRIKTVPLHLYWINTHHRLGVAKIINEMVLVYEIPDSIIVSFPRYNVLGLDFESSIRECSIRGEFAFYDNMFQRVSYGHDPDSVNDYIHQSPEISGIVGIDRSFGNHLYMNMQLYGNYIVDYVADPINKRKQTDIQLITSAKLTFSKERIQAIVTHAGDFSFNDGLVDASVEFKFIKNFSLKIGTRLFYAGKEQDLLFKDYGLYASYLGQDHLYLRVKYFF